MSRRLKRDIPGPDWRVAPDRLRDVDWPGLFPELGRPERLVVEIGFGRGELLMDGAAREPKTAFLGIEVSHKRVLKLARRLARTELVNVRLIEAAAERVVGELLPAASVACCWINFPDPWPKKRHRRRRLVQPGFVHQLARCLEPGGAVHIATDHADYAEAIDAALSGEPLLQNAYAPERFRREGPLRIATAYELEWRALGRDLHYFMYVAKPAGHPAGPRHDSGLDTPEGGP